MIETLTIITVCVLLLVYFRPGTTPQSTTPMVIERIGLYRITLAPQLNLAQPFIEAIAKSIGSAKHATVDEEVYVFEVRDKRVTPKGYDFYELAITQKGGLLCFEARAPLPESKGVRDAVHAPTPDLRDIVQHVAVAQGINIAMRKEMSIQ